MIDGKWEFSFVSPLGKHVMDMDVKVEGSEFTGTLNGKINSNVAIMDGKIDGDTIRFSALLQTPKGVSDTTTVLTLCKDTEDEKAIVEAMSGTISTKFGRFDANAKKYVTV